MPTWINVLLFIKVIIAYGVLSFFAGFAVRFVLSDRFPEFERNPVIASFIIGTVCIGVIIGILYFFLGIPAYGSYNI